MKESIHTIPLMDAFKAEDECPFCYLEREAELLAEDSQSFDESQWNNNEEI